MKYLNRMKKINVIVSIFLLGLVMLTINACKKDSVTSTSPYNIRMTDAPGPYTAVYIDLQGVEITGTDGRPDC